jgi:LuxR family maltose regulon positive regulatory protein
MTVSRKPGLIVLQTKLNRPSVTRDLVVRPRLLKQLNAGLEGAITLVAAPAGFGKTTLVSSWLQAANGHNGATLPYTWLSLDEGDSDGDVFLRYFVAALRVIFSEACPQTSRLLDSRQQPPTRVLMSTLSNEIEQLSSPFVMVMDDLHAPHGRALFDNLNEWLHHWPRQMHLVLLSRFNPPLPLTSLRAKGLLTEIRARDLRFSQDEAAEYFNQVLGLPSDEPTVVLLQQRLEGWIAGLKMASLSLGERESMRDMTDALLDNEVFIADYLVDEVIASQPPKIQRFLLKTSILDQVSVSLAEALMDEQDAGCDARECVDYIESADLFLVHVDNQREWYRYHRMFRDVLRQKLPTVMSATQIEDMHARAADWFYAHGLPDQAIHHALEANNLNLAASYMEQGLCEALNREDRPVIERWLRMLPEEFINQSPGLLIMRAFLHALRWEAAPLAQTTRQAEALIDQSDRSERTQLHLGLVGALEATSYYDANQYDQVILQCQQALSNLPAQWQYARGMAASYMGMGIHASGRPEAAQQFLTGQYESYRDKGDGYALRLLLSVTVNHLQSGNYENAERTARMILQQAEQGSLLVMKGWGYYLLGFLNYEWNELEKAADYFGRVTDLFYTTQLAAARNGMIGQAWTAQALGRPAEAMQIIDKLSDYDLEVRGYEQVDTMFARARLFLMSGAVEAAERWIDVDTSRLPDQSLLIWMAQPPLTKARILLARNRGADTRTALQILAPIGELAERTNNVRITIEVLALRALALLNQGDSAGAREAIIRSVELARRGPFTRTFVDLGPQMHSLLTQIAGHATVSKSVSRILAAFPSAEAPQTPAALLSHSVPVTQGDHSDNGDLDEHLTPRELEILTLMAEPISFREIASRMNISYTTARRYTINVYSKFGVHSRWEVVDCAIRNGIIARR